MFSSLLPHEQIKKGNYVTIVFLKKQCKEENSMWVNIGGS